MTTLSLDTDALILLACQILQRVGAPSAEPVVRAGLSLTGSQVQFRVGPAKVTASVSTMGAGVKLTLAEISIAGIPVGSLARPTIRKAILAKLALASPLVKSSDTPDANILVWRDGLTVHSAGIANGTLSLQF